MQSAPNQTLAVRIAILAIGILSVLFALRAMADIVAPFMLAILFAVLFRTLLDWLQRRGLPAWAAATVVGVSVLLAGVAFYLIVGSALSELSAAVPALQEKLESQSSAVENSLSALSAPISQMAQDVKQWLSNPTDILGFVVQGLSGLLSNALLILFYVLFMVLEAGSMHKKVMWAFGEGSMAATQIPGVVASMRQYLVVQTILSAIVGAAVLVCLWLLRIDFAVVWGVLAFFLNFVPNFGPVLAAIPAVIMAFIQYGASIQVVLVILAYTLIVLVVGSVLFPRMMGRSVGLSPLVVLVSLILWGWILGPIGLVLSVPIVAAIRIFLGASPSFRWLAILLGNQAEPDASGQARVAD